MTEETRYMNIRYNGTIATSGGSGIILATCSMDDQPTTGTSYYQSPNDILSDWNHVSVEITKTSTNEFVMTGHYWRPGGSGSLTFTTDVQPGEQLWVYQILRNAVEHATEYHWYRLAAVSLSNKFGSLTSWTSWTTADPAYTNILHNVV